MKTTLPLKISNIVEAKEFLKSLADNDEIFHPEDDAHSIIWDLPENQKPTSNECDQLNKLMEEIYALNFDPCEYILNHAN